MRTMVEYHDLYLKCDILLLGDLFKNFTKTYLQYYKLDPCHCFTSPGLSWDAMLKMTNVQLELTTDIDTLHFIEKGMRGGISYIANRNGEANKRYMTGYDPQKPSKHIMYLGPVVRTPVSANLGLTFNPGFFFFIDQKHYLT